MRALIVDDEARVRKAVKILVNWEQHHITEVLEAQSGSEAIQMIKEKKPSLVIMDMMMQDGDGLELMSWVSEFSGHIKFIVVSGHNDFDFVRHTVRHGGIDYILKPIDADAINIAVNKAVTSFLSEEEERVHKYEQRIRLNEIQPIYEEKKLTALIDDPFTSELTLRRLIEDSVIPNHVGQAMLLLLQTDPGDLPLLQRFAGDNELLHYALVNICNEFLHADHIGTAFRYWSKPNEIVILLWRYDQVITLIDKINQGIFRTLNRRMHFGISSVQKFPADLSAQHEEALQALCKRNLLYHENNYHIFSATDDNLTPQSPYLSFIPDEWRMAIMTGRKEALAQVSKNWIQGLSKLGFVSPEVLITWKSDAIQFRQQIVREMTGEDAEVIMKRLESKDQLTPSPYPNGYAFSLAAWREWVQAFMEQLLEVIITRQSRENTSMNNIIKYIEQHYHDELSLQEVAAKFFVSREYVSRRFKQEYGINFTDYIGKYRIEKAKLLMQNQYLKLSQIAEMVGFHDVKYFSKVFKKQEGLSPKEYRLTLPEA